MPMLAPTRAASRDLALTRTTRAEDIGMAPGSQRTVPSDRWSVVAEDRRQIARRGESAAATEQRLLWRPSVTEWLAS
jgi:hypothetical protein